MRTARAEFAAIDAAGEGSISKPALRAALAQHGVGTKQADALHAALDLDGDGEVDLDEWIAGFAQFREAVEPGSAPKPRAVRRKPKAAGSAPKPAAAAAAVRSRAGRPKLATAAAAARGGAKPARARRAGQKAEGPPQKKAPRKGKGRTKGKGKGPKEPTAEELAVLRLQCAMRQRAARSELARRRQKEHEFEAAMALAEAEAARLQMEREVAEYRREQEQIKAERKRRAERKAARKAMLDAAFDGDSDGVLARLRNELVPVSVDDRDENNNTALSEAAAGGHTATVRLLLAEGADPNIAGQFQRTPLWRASFANHGEAARSLLEGGADYLSADEAGTSSLLLAQSYGFDDLAETYKGWDLAQTERLKAEIERRKQEKAAEAAAAAQHAQAGLQEQVSRLEQESIAAGRQLRSGRCVLERRITEFDEEKAGLSGSAVPFAETEGVHLAGIREAEGVVAALEAEAAAKKEQLELARYRLRESERVTATAGVPRTEGGGEASDEEVVIEEEELPGLRVPLKELADVLITDVGGRVRDDGRGVLLVDPGRQANTFLRYRDCNYLQYCSSRDMQANTIRIALLGAIRFGKPLVIDIAEVPVDLDEDVGAQFELVEAGLWRSLLAGVQAFCEQKKYLSLIRPEECEDVHQEYHPANFQKQRTDRFMVILLTAQNAKELPAHWLAEMNPIHMVVEDKPLY